LGVKDSLINRFEPQPGGTPDGRDLVTEMDRFDVILAPAEIEAVAKGQGVHIVHTRFGSATTCGHCPHPLWADKRPQNFPRG
jgi:hypothetical protein